MNLYYRQVGETGPAIVILHGLFGSSDNWLTISKAIAEPGYRVFLVDQRNHGQSPHTTEHDYVGMADDLRGFLTDHSLSDAILVGHSMGGKTVMQYAMNYPGTFRKLVVVDIAPKFYPIHHADIIRGFNAIDLTTLKSRNEADKIMSQYESSLAVRQFLLKNLYRNEQGQFAWRINLPLIERELHGIGGDLTDTTTVTSPTLFIRGSESPYITDADIPAIQLMFPHSTVLTIEGAGHWVQAEKPDEFVTALMKFVNE